MERARANKLDPVIGRDDEIRNVIRILSRKSKNNPVLIGEPGSELKSRNRPKDREANRPKRLRREQRGNLLKERI